MELKPLFTLKDARRSEIYFPPSPVFRRISQNRVEAWTSREGWLFNGKGHLLVDVRVPRRDGTGREWFGAFLPNGTWITTDIWDNDQQLNCYTPGGTWKWQLPGSDIAAKLPDTIPATGVPIYPSIGWARADKSGGRWLVSVGTEYNRGYALIDPARRIEPLPPTVHLWGLVYPRAMNVRGMYTSLFINSDDGQETLHREEAGHGMGVGWPDYSLSNKWDRVINEGNSSFGFWPRSHSFYIETGWNEPAPNEVWFFNESGKYEGQVTGSFLGDDATGKNILLQSTSGEVLEAGRKQDTVSILSLRAFKWPEGSVAIPLALYDNLKLGFFLRGSNLAGLSDDARRARGGADIVLGRWN